MKPNKYELGIRGQQEAEKHLCQKDYHVLERNYRIRTGEIDLILQSGKYIIFVEVKYRGGLSHGTPGEAVGYRKQQKIIHTAMHYISRYGLENQDFRFDVVEVLETDGNVIVNHIENAFGM